MIQIIEGEQRTTTTKALVVEETKYSSASGLAARSDGWDGRNQSDWGLVRTCSPQVCESGHDSLLGVSRMSTVSPMCLRTGREAKYIKFKEQNAQRDAMWHGRPPSISPSTNAPDHDHDNAP